MYEEFPGIKPVDSRPNVILHPTEPKILAVLDWELSTLGDPLDVHSGHTPISEQGD